MRYLFVFIGWIIGFFVFSIGITQILCVLRCAIPITIHMQHEKEPAIYSKIYAKIAACLLTWLILLCIVIMLVYSYAPYYMWRGMLFSMCINFFLYFGRCGINSTNLNDYISTYGKYYENIDSQSFQNEKDDHTRYCKYCGSAIDSNKKCTGCGKQYFRLPRINVHYAIIAFLILVIVALLYECAILNTRNAQLANGDIWFIKDQQTYKEQCDWYQNVLDNMGIAFVFDDGYYWHRPNCEKVAEHPNLQLYSGTIEEFKDEGYEECPLCY